jgi:hypothetical protein
VLSCLIEVCDEIVVEIPFYIGSAVRYMDELQISDLDSRFFSCFTDSRTPGFEGDISGESSHLTERIDHLPSWQSIIILPLLTAILS